MKNYKKILVLAVAALLLVAVSVAGTMAYLQAKTSTLTNEFKPSTVGVQIEESTGNTYKVVPGVDFAKDPKVTATYDVDSYLFVVVTEENWNTNLGWDFNDAAWDELMNGTAKVENVFYKELTANTDGTTKTDSFYVLAGDSAVTNGTNGVITVSENMKLSDMTDITTNVPKLTFQAYIIQKAGFASAYDAYAQALTTENP